MPPGLDVTVYPVISAPPLFVGALKLTIACPLPASAITSVGASGTVLGVTLFDAAEVLPLPAAFVAKTSNVYAVPFVNPLTVIGLSVPDAVIPPGLDVTVYPVIVAPPLLSGTLKITSACSFPIVAETSVGAPGMVLGVTLFEEVEGSLFPFALVA